MGSAEHIRASASNSAAGHWLILATVTVATGLAAGLGGMVLGLLPHFTQHIAYGYGLQAIVGHESFLQGVSASSPMRRVVVLCVCGAVAGTGWWALSATRSILDCEMGFGTDKLASRQEIKH